MLVISCDTCSHQRSAHCADCLVTHLCGRSTNEAVVLDLDEQRAFRLLAQAGLAPEIAHQQVG